MTERHELELRSIEQEIGELSSIIIDCCAEAHDATARGEHTAADTWRRNMDCLRGRIEPLKQRRERILLLAGVR